jgi:zinc D-Ala-D-Ala dipeptidase
MLRSKPVRAMSTLANLRLKFAFQPLPVLLAALLLGAPGIITGQSSASLAPGPKPPDVPQAWKPWIGEYGPSAANQNTGMAFVLGEKDGIILLLSRELKADDAKYKAMEELPANTPPPSSRKSNLQLRINTQGERILTIGGFEDGRLSPEANATAQVVIKPQRPMAELRHDALAASPPHEDGTFRNPELVELRTLDPAIHLDIRYATTNDFLGTPVYTQARAFLQRPAAESLVRALHKLQPLGYGLLIHDAYRPWYVTKIFWDATPAEGKIFVADPKEGSRHNRGCAVDLTLYDLASGQPIEMPGTYDEMSPRSFPDYPGGTSLQRWHRDLLRHAMESEGFTVYEHEWWHFDYKDWREYPILNIKFEDLHSGQGLASAQ